MANLYCSSVAWTAVTAWAANTAYAVGDIRRQLADPGLLNARVFRCTVAGTSHLTTEPTWVLTAGATTADNTVTWTEITGLAIWNGDGGGTAWAAPFRALTASLVRAAAGDNIFVASNHAATQTTALNYISNGTLASPVMIISVDETIVPATNLTTGKAGASETASGSYISVYGGSGTGILYVWGVTFATGTSGAIGIAASYNYYEDYTFENCRFELGNASSASSIGHDVYSALVGCSIRLIDCTWKFGHAGQTIYLYNGWLKIRNMTVDAAGTAPTTLFTTNTGKSTDMYVCASDLSKVTGNLVSMAGNVGVARITISDCKLGAGVTLKTGTILGRMVNLWVQNCDSGATNYRDYKARYDGTITEETTTKMTGGASDGTTGISWAMASAANVKLQNPLLSDEFCIWNELTGSAKTITVEVAGASALTNAEAWIEVEYLGSAASPLGTVIKTKVATPLTAGVAYTASAQTWGGAPANKQYMTVSITPQMKGYIKCRLALAKASYTMYVNPVIAVS